MSKIMVKMLAEMAGITPEQLAENVELFQQHAIAGVQLLEQINNRLAAIENHLGISEPQVFVDESATLEKRLLEDGEKIRD